MKSYLTQWLICGITPHFTSTIRHSMDELTFGGGHGSSRFTRNNIQSLVPQYAILNEAAELAAIGFSAGPELPTPTDVPVPEPHDVPVPEPIDVPPPEPHDVPPPKPTDPIVDPKPRPVP
jgi:hypothetical protein